MRWEGLFDDLAAQAEQLERAERAAEVSERARIEVAGLKLSARLAAAVGSTLRLTCAGNVVVRGVLSRATPACLLLDEAGGREALVPVCAVLAVAGLPAWAVAPARADRVAGRLGLASALRMLARDRFPVRIHLVTGEAVEGTIDRVGSDFLELAAHPAGEWRRSADVRGSLVVATAALAAVRRGSDGPGVS